MKHKKILMAITLFILMFGLFGCNNKSEKSDESSGGNKKSSGGELRIAALSQPPTMDPHITTSSVTRDVSRHIFETLVTLNSDYEVVPMLAESVKESEDRKSYIFQLREGVKFHNGQEMVSEDVVASMNRWKDNSTSAQVFLKDATFEADGEYTVVLKLTEPSPLVLNVLAGTNQFAAIVPKKTIETATEKGIEQNIGTGPFKFVEWKQDQYIHLEKFADYQSLDSPADGISGKKEALIDDLYFEYITDESTRLAGIQTGQYDIAQGLPHDFYQQLVSNPDLEMYVPFDATEALLFNKYQGWFTDIKMRQAINHALEIEKILMASTPEEDLFRLNSSYMLKEQAQWYSESGSEFYNQHNPEKAKQLLNEAGYNGEEIVILTTRDFPSLYNSAVVIQQQLEKVGIQVKLDVYDYPTLVNRRVDPEKWDLYVTGIPTVSTPIELVYFNENFFDGPNDENTVDLLEAVTNASSLGEAVELWDELQEYSWEFLPIVKFGDSSTINSATKNVEGFTVFDGPVLWNTKVSN